MNISLWNFCLNVMGLDIQGYSKWFSGF